MEARTEAFMSNADAVHGLSFLGRCYCSVQGQGCSGEWSCFNNDVEVMAPDSILFAGSSGEVATSSTIVVSIFGQSRQFFISQNGSITRK